MHFQQHHIEFEIVTKNELFRFRDILKLKVKASTSTGHFDGCVMTSLLFSQHAGGLKFDLTST